MSGEANLKKEKDQAPVWRLNSWFPDLGAETHDQLKKFFLELLKFNKTINLISAKTEPVADAIHFSDSILSSRIVYKNINNSKGLYDIGSGNGFPGLVYSILYPDQKIILLDSDERKCEFLKHVARVLVLNNVTVKNIKIEHMGPNSIEQAICRGFAPLPRALLMLRKIIKIEGSIFHLKSEEWAIEVSQIPIQLCSLWRPSLVGDYCLPVGDKIKMCIVRTEKIS